MSKEYYDLLGVSEDASEDKIKKAYRKKAKKYHPDSNKDTSNEEKFKKINKAYDVLGDEEKRKKYDRYGKQGVEGRSSRGRQRAASNFQDIFEQIFGGGRRRRQRQERGETLRINTTISLEQAFEGVEKTFEVTRKAVCDECDGSGAENGETNTCSECNGQGRVRRMKRTPFGRTETVAECPKCDGRGKVPKETCNECNGQGLVDEEETIAVDIPSGIRDGQRMRLENKGNASRNGRNGDIELIVNVEADEEFERKDANLFTTLDIGIGDAILGAEVEIDAPSGNFEVTVPEGAQPGQVLRLRGKGMPSRRGHGDLHVKLDVEIPEKVDEEDAEVFKKYKNEKEMKNSFFETVKDFI